MYDITIHYNRELLYLFSRKTFYDSKIMFTFMLSNPTITPTEQKNETKAYIYLSPIIRIIEFGYAYILSSYIYNDENLRWW